MHGEDYAAIAEILLSVVFLIIFNLGGRHAGPD
jgi:hypothetical protein